MKNNSSYTLRVQADDSSFKLNIKELLLYKDLFFVLAYRDLRIRYAQTFIGLLWAFIQPAFTLLIVSVVFGKFVRVDTGTIPHPLFAVSGIAVWTYFSFVLSQAGNSLIGAQEMLKKIYFPRLVIPFSKAVVGLVDFAVALVIMTIMFFYYGYVPSSNILFLPLILLLVIMVSLAAGIWLSALSIRYRDFQYIIPFLVQFGLYITPVAYPITVVSNNLPDWATLIYYLNPMAGLIEGFRWCLFGGAFPSTVLLLSIVSVIILFITSIYYFRKTEKIMADII